MYEQFLNLRLV